jgi:molybdate transport system permease protein
MSENKEFKAKSDAGFFTAIIGLGGFYIVMIILLVLADVARVDMATMSQVLSDPNIVYSIKLSLLSCTITTVLALWVSIPIGYMMSRMEFKGKLLVDAVLDIPIVLPPLVLGLSLLILFNFPPFVWINEYVEFEIPAVIIAQFMVACAFAVRTMRTAFDMVPFREEEVARTLGCSRGQAFWQVVLPRVNKGIIGAATLAWARSMGEFGPILIFAGSTRMRTEVLPTSVFLEIQSGNLKGAIGVSLIMIFISVVVLILARVFGIERSTR